MPAKSKLKKSSGITNFFSIISAMPFHQILVFISGMWIYMTFPGYIHLWINLTLPE